MQLPESEDLPHRSFKYNRLYETLADKIRTNIWKPGDRLPTERALCDAYGVSRVTVRSTLQRLELDGYIHRRQGCGTFVSIPHMEQKLTKLYSLREEFHEKGIPHSTKILSFRTLPAAGAAGEKLALKSEILVFELIRCLFADHVPYTVETSYIPADFFPGLTGEKIAENGLYASMRGYGLPPRRAEENLRLAYPAKREAALLNLSPREAVIRIERTTFSGAQPIEYTINTIRGDYFYYSVNLE